MDLSRLQSFQEPGTVGTVLRAHRLLNYHCNDRGHGADSQQSTLIGPHGERLGIVEATPNPFGYVGRYGVMEEGNGLKFMRARYYDDGSGRFLNKDLVPGDIRNPQSLNRYAYVDSVGKPLLGTNLYIYASNSPINRIDPYGLADWHFDRTPTGERLIHSGQYRFNEAGELVDHVGRQIKPDPCKGQSEKWMKSLLKWLRGNKPDFFRFGPLLIWVGGVYDQSLDNMQNGLPVDYNSYDEFGRPTS